jgi:hypothetical protein
MKEKVSVNVKNFSFITDAEANYAIAFVPGKYLQAVFIGVSERCSTQVGKHLKWVEMLAGTEQAYLV